MSRFKISSQHAKDAQQALEIFVKETVASEPDKQVFLLLSDLIPNPKNKEIYSMNDIDKLAKDIEENGLITPLSVRPGMNDGQYQIISGERRYRACKLINYEPVPAIIVEGKTELEYRRLLIAANSQRIKTPLDFANEIDELKHIYSEMKKAMPEYLLETDINKQVADDLGVSRATVLRTARLNSLIPEMQYLIQSSEIAHSTAERFADMDEETQRSIVSFIKEKAEKGEKLSLSEAQKIQQDYKAAQAEIERKDRELFKLNQELSDLTNANKVNNSVSNNVVSDKIEMLNNQIKIRDEELEVLKKQKFVTGDTSVIDIQLSALCDSVKRIAKEYKQIDIDNLTTEQKGKLNIVLAELKSIVIEGEV